jgi:Tol biopolymer transport system component
MSPEQVSGLRADHPSDVFSFGAVLYEMLAGHRAFQGQTAVEVMAAILREDPVPLSAVNPAVPPGLERLVSHCLEKHPEARFESARDLAFQLEGLSHSTISGEVPRVPASRRPWRRRSLWSLAVLGAAAVALVGFLLGRRAQAPTIPVFRQLTFRRGSVLSARFSPDGNTILYSASWDGAPPQVFSTRLDSVESRPLGLSDTQLLGVARGEMVVLLKPNAQHLGTLGRAPLDGGAVREVLDDIADAAWSSQGDRLAVVRANGSRRRLEFPVGKVLHEAAGTILNPRVSPQGDLVAFIERPVPDDTRGSIKIATDTRVETVSAGWNSIGGLAWSADGRELLFTATKVGSDNGLYATTRDGRERLVSRVAGDMWLQDISREGRVLFTHSHGRIEVNGVTPGEPRERDLSWLDGTGLADLSGDAKTLIFTESGEGGGALYSVYLRRLDGGQVVRLGEGGACGLSPDGKWVIAMLPTSPSTITLLPTKAGQPMTLLRGSISEYQGAWWFPDGRHILIKGNQAGKPARFFMQGDFPHGLPEPVGPEEAPLVMPFRPITHDGRFLGPCPSASLVLCRYTPGAATTAAEPVPGLEAGDQPLSWSADGRFVFVRSGAATGRTAQIIRLNLLTGARELWKELTVADPAGVRRIYQILLTPDGRSYVYQYFRSLDVLYLAEGLN